MGKSFPEDAKQIQQADFSKCNLIVEAFYRSDQRAVTDEDNVRKLAQAARAQKRKTMERMPLPRL
jgi:hypothetical protein